MPIKHYGIYIAYPPTVDMRDQGLGRHLAIFLKGAESLTDIRFTIVCPSWSRETLEVLFESEQVSSEIFEIVTPEGKPYALKLFEAFKAYRQRPGRPGWLSQITKSTAYFVERLWERLTARAVTIYSPATLIGFLIPSILLLMMLLPLGLLGLLVLATTALYKTSQRLVRGYFSHFNKELSNRISRLLASPQNDTWALRLFDAMQKEEALRMQAKIACLVDVRAWYCPTAFWPEFHNIKAPRLMCVPDVMLSEFPIGFCSVGGDRFLGTFETVGRAIRGGEYFVTYSDAVKWNTLVDRYAVPASNVAVIPHAPSTLNQHVEISGFPNAEATSRHYCQALLRGALQRSTNPAYTATFRNGDVKFLFYASQFRPNKNVLMLLRAFENLLRKRYLGHKLILTGRPSDMPEISRFVVDHRFENDVIFLHGLSVSELAACYKLADLAVNPSLSEGGCPFTITEALSVGTPVVMSRIAVAEEVLTDAKLQEITFFDPYNWQDCAKRIEWAVTHREELLKLQLDAYATLCKRTWTDVVAEHVKVLDEISSGAQVS